MNKKWYKWPENYIANYAPWYKIIRRACFVPIATIFLFLTTVFIGLAYGYKDGLYFWKHNL